MEVKPQIEESWLAVLKEEFQKPYFLALKQFIVKEKKAGKIIYPPGKDIFNAFNSTPFDKVKVVILGQDPYHGPGQAHGLCFSVQHGVKPPPSLVNIYKELNRDLGLPIPQHGFLQKWTEQGVLLLNSILTVQARQAASHHKQGWETFTDAAISHLNTHREGIVFMLWGRYAQNKGLHIDTSKHLVLKTTHPSPFSAHNGFLGSGQFSKANAYLKSKGEAEVDWSV